MESLYKKTEELTASILERREQNGCWNVLRPGDKYYPDFQYYCPKYKSTLWTMIYLADIGCRTGLQELEKPFKMMSEHFFDEEYGIYSLGKSHFPIPCLNGNMLYLHNCFGFEDKQKTIRIIDFFTEYQRFDDGDFKTPTSFPYYNNRSCYGRHTCFWGIIKLFKGLSYIPQGKRSSNAELLIRKCIDFILLHNVCFRSHNKTELLHPTIGRLGFPHMYTSDFLEILRLLMREGVRDPKLDEALELLSSKQSSDGRWQLERKTSGLVVSFPAKKYGDYYITAGASEVMEFYSASL